MVAERVPRQLADEAVILVQVVPRVREDQIRLDRALQLLEALLDLAADVREEAVAERRGRSPSLARRRRETPRRSPEPPSRALRRLAKTTHVTSSSGRVRASVSIVPPQPISMSSAWQPSASTRAAARCVPAATGRARQSSSSGRAPRRRRARQGALPVSTSASRRCLSLIVSIGCPEALVAVGDQLARARSAAERLDRPAPRPAGSRRALAPEDEEPAVDPDVGRWMSSIARTIPSASVVDDVRVEHRAAPQMKRRRLPRRVEALDHRRRAERR